jgi:hypothetical protein
VIATGALTNVTPYRSQRDVSRDQGLEALREL